MPTYRDEVVVLRTHKLGEADRIVTMLSRRHGKLRAVAKGVRRTSSRFGARLEPFMVADVLLYQGRNLDIVQQAESLGSYGADIAVHYDRYTSANAMVEAADRLNEAEATPQQYLLLVGGLRALAARRARVAQHPGFLPPAGDGPVGLGSRSGGVRALRRAGTARHVRRSAGRHDLPRLRSRGSRSSRRPHGGACCPRSWRATGDVADAASAPTRGSASGLIAAYAQWHLERGIRSLEHVEAAT